MPTTIEPSKPVLLEQKTSAPSSSLVLASSASPDEATPTDAPITPTAATPNTTATLAPPAAPDAAPPVAPALSPHHTFNSVLREYFGAPSVLRSAICGTCVTGVWLLIFTLGLAVPSQPFRDRLLALGTTAGANLGLFGIVQDVVTVALVYTPTNLMLLCCVSSLVGCLARLATTRAQAEARRAPATAEKPRVAEEPIAADLAPAISAVTWGFFIYLVVLSGTIVITGEPFKATSPESYLRVAGTTSLFAFAVGWRPEILTTLVRRIGDNHLGSSIGRGAEKKT